MVTVTLGTLPMNGGVQCYRWAGVLALMKRGANRPIPAVAGRAVRERTADETRGFLNVRLRGHLAIDGTFLLGSPEERHARLYDHLDALWEVCDVNTPQTLTIDTGGGVLSAQVIVEGTSAPNIRGGTGTLVVEVTLHEGRATLASS